VGNRVFGDCEFERGVLLRKAGEFEGSGNKGMPLKQNSAFEKKGSNPSQSNG